jgi:uncharacterized protein (DUF302 family)
MRPTELLIFGNATAGTPLMQATQTIGIDLPLKALAWEDASGRVWLSYNDPGWLAHRQGSDASSAAATGAMTAMLASIAQSAAAAPSRTSGWSELATGQSAVGGCSPR